LPIDEEDVWCCCGKGKRLANDIAFSLVLKRTGKRKRKRNRNSKREHEEKKDKCSQRLP
jgi:hypothetical protein